MSDLFPLPTGRFELQTLLCTHANYSLLFKCSLCACNTIKWIPALVIVSSVASCICSFMSICNWTDLPFTDSLTTTLLVLRADWLYSFLTLLHIRLTHSALFTWSGFLKKNIYCNDAMSIFCRTWESHNISHLINTDSNRSRSFLSREI